MELSQVLENAGLAEKEAKVYLALLSLGTASVYSVALKAGIKQFVREISARQIPVRDLLTKSKENQMFAQELRHVSNYQIRFAREGKGFSTDSALFGDKVAFFSFAPQIFVAVIKSSQIVTSVRSLYELAWESAQPLPKG